MRVEGQISTRNLVLLQISGLVFGPSRKVLVQTVIFLQQS